MAGDVSGNVSMTCERKCEHDMHDMALRPDMAEDWKM